MEDLGDLKLSHWGDFPLPPFIARGYIVKDHLVVNGGKVLELGWARGIHVPVLKWGAQELLRVSRPHDSFYTVYPYTHTCITCVYLPFSLSIIYIYILHTYMHAYIHTYIHAYIHTYRQTYIHTYTYLPTYIHTYIHTSIHASMHACMHTYIHTYTDLSISTDMTHTHIYITYTCACLYGYMYGCSHCGHRFDFKCVYAYYTD